MWLYFEEKRVFINMNNIVSISPSSISEDGVLYPAFWIVFCNNDGETYKVSKDKQGNHDDAKIAALKILDDVFKHQKPLHVIN